MGMNKTEQKSQEKSSICFWEVCYGKACGDSNQRSEPVSSNFPWCYRKVCTLSDGIRLWRLSRSTTNGVDNSETTLQQCEIFDCVLQLYNCQSITKLSFIPLLWLDGRRNKSTWRLASSFFVAYCIWEKIYTIDSIVGRKGIGSQME